MFICVYFSGDSKQDDGDPNGKEAEAHRRERKRKSRWGEDPPADIKPPGIAPPLPPMLPGQYLLKLVHILHTNKSFSELGFNLYLLKYFLIF